MNREPDRGTETHSYDCSHELRMEHVLSWQAVAWGGRVRGQTEVFSTELIHEPVEEERHTISVPGQRKRCVRAEHKRPGERRTRHGTTGMRARIAIGWGQHIGWAQSHGQPACRREQIGIRFHKTEMPGCETSIGWRMRLR